MKEKRKESIIMPAKKKHPVRLEELTPDEKVKYEIAEELGLLDRVMQDGWKSLTSKETLRKRSVRLETIKKMTKILRMLISMNIM